VPRKTRCKNIDDHYDRKSIRGRGCGEVSTHPLWIVRRNTEEVMGWGIGSDGFRIALSVDVATVTENYLGEDVRGFLADYGLSPQDVSTWVCRPGGPRVIEAVEAVLDLPGEALEHAKLAAQQRQSFFGVGARRASGQFGRSAGCWFDGTHGRHGSGFLLRAGATGVVATFNEIVKTCITC